MKIEVGTKLTVRSDLNEGMDIRFGVNKEMEALAAKTVTVTEVIGAKIKIDLDCGEWIWSLNMFSEFATWIKSVLNKHKKWVRNEEGGERANLCGADLRYADLRDADLRYADLRDANLCDADLCGADLRDADLRDANLCDADLCGADLRDADLRYANLCDANLCGANLCGADLRDANLCDADLRDANLRGADGDDIKIKKVMFVGPIGSRDDTTQIFFTTENKILVKCGCFYNYINEFEKAVHKEHEGTKYERQYMAMIELIKAMSEE